MTANVLASEKQGLLAIANTDKKLLQNIGLAVGFAALLGILSQLKFYIPGNPVPISGQTLGVMLCGAFLGWKLGAISVLFYIGLGFNGVPWFTGGAAGVNLFTVGYLLGFVPQAAIVGFFVEKFKVNRNALDLMLVMVLSTVVMYAFGAGWIYLVAAPVVSKSLSFVQVLSFAVTPFLFVASIKIYMSALIVRALKK